MHFDKFAFGSIQIDGSTFEHDVAIDRGEVRKRKKKPSKKFRDEFGHTPLSVEEKIPWKCQRLVVGTGAYGGLPVMEEVKQEAQRTAKLTYWFCRPPKPSRRYSKAPKTPTQCFT